MILAREEIVELEDLYYNKQERIYPDSCDSGYVVHSKEENDKILDIIARLSKIVKPIVESGKYNNPTSGYSTIKFFIPIEQNDYISSKMDGCEITITKCWDLKHTKKTWYAIDISQKTR